MFFSQPRDSLLASLLDGVRASGNRDVCVKMTSTQKGQRWGLLSMPVDEEVESLHLRFLAAPPSKLKLIMLFYNALLTIQMLSQMLHTYIFIFFQMVTLQMLYSDSMLTFPTVEYYMRLRRM